MDVMTDFMTQQMISDKIKEVAEKYYDCKIVNEDLRQKSINDMKNVLNALTESAGDADGSIFDDYASNIIGTLLDIVLAQIILINFQKAYIEEEK